MVVRWCRGVNWTCSSLVDPHKMVFPAAILQVVMPNCQLLNVSTKLTMAAFLILNHSFCQMGAEEWVCFVFHQAALESSQMLSLHCTCDRADAGLRVETMTRRVNHLSTSPMESFPQLIEPKFGHFQAVFKIVRNQTTVHWRQNCQIATKAKLILLTLFDPNKLFQLSGGFLEFVLIPFWCKQRSLKLFLHQAFTVKAKIDVQQGQIHSEVMPIQSCGCTC